MTAKRWIPWNWFKKEERKDKPVLRREGPSRQNVAVDLPLDHFHREVDRLFEQAFRSFGRAPFWSDGSVLPRMSGGIFRPSLDVGATEKEYSVTVGIPGVDENDLQLEVVDDTLTVRCEKKQEKEDRDKGYYRIERHYGSFQRVLTLPEDADREGVEAAFRKGVLTVTIPRKESPKEPARKIEVRKAA